MQIIRATIGMADNLVSLSKTLGYEVDLAGVKKRLNDINSRKDQAFFVAVDEGKAVGFTHGYLRLLVEVPEAIEIGGLAVVDGYQGKGVGKKLIEAVETWAREKKILWIVLSSNILRQGAHGFYEHLGYKKVKQQYVFEKHLKLGDVA
jgi:GNAT superfamily N-acetyltransferase